MATIMKQRVFASTRSSGTNVPELPGATRGCPTTHVPIATFSLQVAWPHKQRQPGDRCRRGREATAFFPLLLFVAVLLATAGTFVAATYLSGRLMQRIQNLQRYNEPRAQYSDVWKWQGKR
jgi:hypothetical protein